MKRWVVGLAAVVATFGGTAEGSMIYTNDFEGAIGSEWSSTNTALTPVGSRRFLGLFQEETVSLTLAVPDMHWVLLSFELFAVQTWDGSQLVDPHSPSHTVGPDLWRLSIGGGPVLLNTTFSVFDGTKPMHSFRDYPQAFPGDYPALDPARTGASENDSLGYFEGDSVYSLSFEFLHTSGPLVVNFSGDFPEFDPEAWGLDNVTVMSSPIPEPSAFIIWTGLLGIGLVGCCRRRRKAG